MKIADDRLKLSITFNEYESRLIREAARIVFAMHDEMDTKTKRADCRRLIYWAVMAFCRAVILKKWRPIYPPVAELREENPMERRERLAGKIPESSAGFNQNTQWN
jgi:hypothetical protein